jgi:putative ABC transport system permease protein
MDTLLGDLRFALRSLRRRPSFALVVTSTIAIAVGATTTMMSVVNAAILRPLPFRGADSLVYVDGFEKREQSPRNLSYLETRDWQRMNRAFSGLAVYDDMSLNIGSAGSDPIRVDAELVSANFFGVMGANAVMGRTFTAEEDRVPDAMRVAVISHDLWQSRFGARNDIVGQSMVVNGRPFTIVGVMAPGFRGVSFLSQVWIPTMMVTVVRPASTLENRTSRWLGMVGRLAPGRSIADARSDLDRVTRLLERDYPETNTNRGARVTSLRAYYLGTTETLLLALFGAAGLLLLIACANVMSLQLVRATGRRREMALRVALGADRWRLIQQLLTEGIVLAAVGAFAGVLLALWAIDMLLPLAPAGLLPGYIDVNVDARVMLLTALITGVSGVAFGLVPALIRTRGGLVPALKTGAPSIAEGLGSLRRMRAHQMFVIGEFALALVLLVGGALMVQSLRHQTDVDPGVNVSGLQIARVTLPLDRYDSERRIQFVNQLTERLHAIPGVTAVAVGADLPLRGLESGGYLTYDGGPPEGAHYSRHRVAPEYFAALGIPVQRGRVFTNADGPNSPLVAVVSVSTARRFWGNADPIGRRVNIAGTDKPIIVEVVGVVGDVRFRDLTGDLSAPLSTVDIYFPFTQDTDETLEMAVRGGPRGAQFSAALNRAVHELDGTLPVFDVASLDDALAQQTSAARFGSLMLSLFAGIAIVLAVVGIYGLLAFVVGTSTREIAIRIALGASPVDVVNGVVRKGLVLAIAGVAVGLTIALPSMGVLSGFLFGVGSRDPLTMFGVAMLLVGASVAACWFPARRASRVAPQVALKSE